MVSEKNISLGECCACKGSVSKKAKTCPHCGEHKPYRPSRNLSPIVSWSIIGFFAISGVGAIMQGPSEPTNFNAGQKQVFIAEGQDRVRALLKDPDSARFKDVYFVDWNNTPVVCGSVNSKNGMGGYIGFQRFVVDGNSGIYFEGKISDFRNVWKKCI